MPVAQKRCPARRARSSARRLFLIISSVGTIVMVLRELFASEKLCRRRRLATPPLIEADADLVDRALGRGPWDRRRSAWHHLASASELAECLRVQVFMTKDDSTAGAEQRIGNAVDAIRSMSQDLADEVVPRPGWLDRLSAATCEAPIQSLAIAFLIGVILARR